jgi:hypothetical protein
MCDPVSVKIQKLFEHEVNIFYQKNKLYFFFSDFEVKFIFKTIIFVISKVNPNRKTNRKSMD